MHKKGIVTGKLEEEGKSERGKERTGVGEVGGERKRREKPSLWKMKQNKEEEMARQSSPTHGSSKASHFCAGHRSRHLSSVPL